MRCEGGGPHSRAVNACDFNLAVGEFEEAWEIGLNVRRSEAFGKKNDLAPGSFDGDSEGVVVAEGVLPDVEHAHLLEEAAANRGASTPTEVFFVAAEHGDYGGVPGSEKGVGKGVVVGDEPAHGSGRANAGVGERSDDVVQPRFAWPAVGVGEDQNFKIGRELFDADSEIVDFFAGGCGLSRDDDIGFHARGGSDPFDEAVRGIVFGSEDEKDLEILVSEFAERNQIALEAGFHATARAEDGGAWSIKTWIGAQAAAHVGEPLNTLPKQEEARGDLENRQEFKESFHAS